MYESLGIESLSAPQAAVFFGLLIGLAFGALAERTGFCLRRSLAGADRASAGAVWLMALATAVIGTQAVMATGHVDFAAHRLFSTDLPWLAIVTGGLLFGVGMILTRGCASRLTVLTATGNLRALTVLLVFAVTAHATLKGILAPLRIWLGSVTADLGTATSLPGLPWAWAGLAVAGAAWLAAKARAPRSQLAAAAALGLLVPLAWFGTGHLLQDDFDPIPVEALSFTAPHADSLFWIIASSAVPAGFGTGLVGGVLLGALATAVIGRRFRWQSFGTPGETGRYIAGAVLMGFGGVLAGGCSVGAGLSGVAGLSVAATLALVAIVAGGLVADRIGRAIRPSPANAEWPTTRPRRPAE